jgi:two-component system, chemotaxis family, protein-glutamate methylesterase/glutaminase
VPKILIADDDAGRLKLLEAALRPTFPRLTVVCDGASALRQLLRGRFDVLITEWMMPRLGGAELIERVRAECSPPPFIIMTTALDSGAARKHALCSGADDFLSHQSPPWEIRACVERATQRHSSSKKLRVATPVPPNMAWRPIEKRPPHVVVAIAASTGGPMALQAVFADPRVPEDCVFLVALHGPEWLHESVAETLRRRSKLEFRLAEDGLLTRPGAVYFACKDRHLLIEDGVHLRFDASPPEHFLRPAADPLFRSVARSIGQYAVALVLTGMGNDGAAGAAEIAARGGVVLAQDPSTATIGSMPAAVIKAGFVREVLPLALVGQGIARHTAVLKRALALVSGESAEPAST